MILTLLLVLYGLQADAQTSETHLEFYGGKTHFHAIKSKSKFSYSDQLGKRELEVKNCNEKVIDDFWDKLTKAYRSVATKKGSLKKSKRPQAWIKFDGIKASVEEFEPAYLTFLKVPKEIHVVFVESKRRCHLKK